MAVPRRIDRLGPYELLEPIGEGGFARVYRVRRGGEELAAKVLSPAASAERTALERFQREIGVLSGIRHPNLIELVDSGVDEALGPYMVTRLVTGMTLRDLARGEPLCPEAALLLIEPVLRALGAMHAVGLVHRDLKPDNVMVTPTGDVVVVDLGLALHGAHSRLTEAGTVTGSVPYLAPEQIEGRDIAPATDLWAVGVTLYELIAGRRPFARERPGEELASILAGAYEPLASVDRRVGEELDRFVGRCLARDPSERVPDAASALAELEQCFDWVTPRQMRAERAAVVTDPHGYAERAAGARVRLLCERAREELARGRDFEALRILDRALSYRPDDEEVLALVDRASGERRSAPAEERASGPAPRATAAPVAGGAPPRASRRRALAALGAVLLAGGAGLGAWLAGGGHEAVPSEREPAPSAREAARAEGEPAPPAREPRAPARPEERAAAPPAPEPANDAPSSPLPQPAPGLDALVPIPAELLRNDDPPREMNDVAQPGEPIVPARLFGPGGPAAALASIEAQLAARPGDVELSVGRALALLGNGREREGLAELERIAREHPENATVWGARGYVAYRQRRLDDAERFLTRAIDLEPTSASDLRNRGVLRAKRGRTRDAYADLTTALRYDPDDVEALSELARVYETVGRRRDARPLLERIVRLRPRSAQAWVDLSMTQAEPEAALASLRRAIALDPGYVPAHTGLCRHLTQHDARGAIEACTRAAELAPRDGSVYMHRGLAHYYLGDTAAALRDLDRAAELSPRDAIVFTNRYLVRSHAGQDARAREDLARACELGHDAACTELRAR